MVFSFSRYVPYARGNLVINFYLDLFGLCLFGLRERIIDHVDLDILFSIPGNSAWTTMSSSSSKEPTALRVVFAFGVKKAFNAAVLL
jgi:hypothetical protein